MAKLKEVAKAAGVSTATVSRYLRGDRVRNCKEIVEAVELLKYKPNIAAKCLRSGIQYAVGMVVPDITNPYFSMVAKGIEAVFRDSQYRLFIANTDESIEIERAVIDDIMPRIDGLIIAPVSEKTRINYKKTEKKIPIVLVDRELPEENYDSVLVDNKNGASLAASYLLELGHKKIGIISGQLTNTPGKMRYDSFISTLKRSGVNTPSRYILISNFKEGGGYNSMIKLMRIKDPPSAVFSANNTMTIGCLKAIKHLKIRVPYDLSIIGFDDVDLSELLSPPLTVIERQSIEQGVIAGNLMLERLQKNGTKDVKKIIIPTHINIRNSCSEFIKNKDNSKDIL